MMEGDITVQKDRLDAEQEEERISKTVEANVEAERDFYGDGERADYYLSDDHRNGS